jgi:hypothetical protein
MMVHLGGEGGTGNGRNGYPRRDIYGRASMVKAVFIQRRRP